MLIIGLCSNPLGRLTSAWDIANAVSPNWETTNKILEEIITKFQDFSRGKNNMPLMSHYVNEDEKTTTINVSRRASPITVTTSFTSTPINPIDLDELYVCLLRAEDDPDREAILKIFTESKNRHFHPSPIKRFFENFLNPSP